MKIIKDTDKAWVAGIIDGEGCIYIHKAKPSKGAKNPCYSLKIRVAMTDFPTIKRLQELYPAVYHEKFGQDVNCRNQAVWECSSIVCANVIKDVLPYIFTKRRQAELAMKFIALPKATSFKETPQWLLKEREDIALQMKLEKDIEFPVTYTPKRKDTKKTKYTACAKCGIKIRAYHENGTVKKYCSHACARRILTVEQEGELYKRYLTNEFSYKDLQEQYQIPRGTLADILKRQRKNKTDASLRSIS